jgi:group I intron endonuclease
MFLYIITNLVNGKQYVGITTDPDKRKSQHFTGCNGSKLVFQAVKKYGIENFTFEILYEGDKEYIKSLEIKIIETLGTMIPSGYNLTAGGDGCWDYKASEETRQKISKLKQGKSRSEETKKKVSEGLKKYYQDNPEVCRRISNRAKNMSVETRKKIGERSKGRKHNLGRKHTIETKQKISASRMGAKNPGVRKVLVNGHEYYGLPEAARCENINLTVLTSKWYQCWKKTGIWPEGFGYI